MALFLTKDLDDDAHSRLGVWHITETEAELKALSSIPSDELEEISFIKSESLRKQKLAVRALLDAMFEEKVYLSHHDNGKPYIENNATNISITHTDKYVAVILNDLDDLFTFYAFPRAIRRSIYTTNLIENFNKNLKRGIKAKEQFPNEDSLERYVCSYYMDYNQRFSLRVHRGFTEAQPELLEMFEQL